MVFRQSAAKQNVFVQQGYFIGVGGTITYPRAQKRVVQLPLYP